MNQFLPSNDPGAQKRRSTRIVQAVPLTVTGVDALGQPFKERTTTVMVNCHGCKYQSKHYVPKNSTITLEVPRPEAELPPRTVVGRVVWVQRPRAVRELFQIGLEFEVPGNVWGIAFPPSDWFPYPDDEVPAASTRAIPQKTTAPAAVPQTPSSVASIPVPSMDKPEPSPAAAASTVAPAKPAAPAGAGVESKVHVMPAPSQPQDVQLAAARQASSLVAEAKETLEKSLRKDAQTAINEEMTFVRQQLDAQLHDAVEKAIKVSMDRVTESSMKKVVQQAADRTAALVDEARQSTRANAEQLESRMRQAVEAMVNQATEQTARQTAQLANTQELNDKVLATVERILSERQPVTTQAPSLDETDQQIRKWKQELAEEAENLRKRATEQGETDAAAASQRWKEALESELTQAGAKLRESLGGFSETTLKQIDENASARTLSARTSVDEIVSAAMDAVQSLGAGLEQERARTEEAKNKLQEAARSTLEQHQAHAEEVRKQAEEAKNNLQEAARSTLEQHQARTEEVRKQAEAAMQSALEQGRARAEEAANQLHEAARLKVDRTRQDLDQIVSSKLEGAGTQAEQIVAARIQQIDPAFQASAQRAVDQLASEIHNTVTPQLDEARRAGAELSNAHQRAADLQAALLKRFQEAADEAAQVQSKVRDQVQQASQEALQSTIDKLKQETARYPAEVVDASRAALSKLEEEFEQKNTEAQHATYEALSKAADWYQKKAQTTMQSTMEKAVEQSATNLRHQAAEISSLVASELDHYRRSYVDHGRAQIEDIAKDVIDLGAGKMREHADVTAASLSDRVQQLAKESLRRFEESARDALEKTRSDMEYGREGSLTRFQQELDQKMTQGVEQAQIYLQSQLGPLVEAWEANRRSQQQVWVEALKKSSEDAMGQYKARLENASNSWLLASATTLGQNSQAVIDALAKTAEKRLRDTVAEVLAGMGDTLKERLLGISGQFSKEEDDEMDQK